MPWAYNEPMAIDAHVDFPPPPAPERWVGERVAWLRRWLPVAIVLTVVLHQAWAAQAYEGWTMPARFAAGMLFYGIAGPAVTWWTLDWIARSIAAREAIETQARRGERYLASITSGSADAIFSLDTKDIVQSWNRGAGEIFGYAAEAVVGRHADLLIPSELRERGELDQIRQRLASEGFIRGHQTRRLNHDGREVDVELTQTLLRTEDGAVVGSSVILRDISDRLSAEAAVRTLNRELEDRVATRTRELQAATEALRSKNEALTAANHELTKLDALKDEFVRLVSHELRAPLTNINASVELLIGQATDAGQRRKLEIIGHEASRLTRLVRSVLDVSRMQAGRLELLPAPVATAHLCAEAVRRFADADHPCRVDVAPGTPPVLADLDRAVQVLDNLLDNAAKYSPPGSRIDLSAGPLPPIAREAPAVGAARPVLFSVTDRGVGIPAEELPRIFERFHRVERHDARETYGHGLGLYIARMIIEGHGGRIWVQSTPGSGSTFLFTLPAAPEEP